MNRTLQSLQCVLAGMYPPTTAAAASATEGTDGDTSSSASPPPPPLVVRSVPLDEEYVFPNTRGCPRLTHVFRTGRNRFAAGGGHTPALLAFRTQLAAALGIPPSEVNFVRLNDVVRALVRAQGFGWG